MNLQIRDPRARILAERLADRLMGIADRLAARSGGTGRDFSREEIDALWGHG